ncbi:MAG: hypothetical protein ACP5QW_03535 [bacterium]
MAGENIKEYRVKQDLSQEDFVSKSGVKYHPLTRLKSELSKNSLFWLWLKLQKHWE